MHTSADKALFMLIYVLTLYAMVKLNHRIRRINLWKNLLKLFWSKLYYIPLDTIFDLSNRQLTLFSYSSRDNSFVFISNFAFCIIRTFTVLITFLKSRFMLKIITSEFPFLFDRKIQTHSMSFVETCKCMKTVFYFGFILVYIRKFSF